MSICYYSDSESLLQETPKECNTEIRHMHKACSYMFTVVSVFDWHTVERKVFIGENAIKIILEETSKIKDEIMTMINSYKQMLISDNEQKVFDRTNIWHICKKNIDMTLKYIQKNNFLIVTSETKLEKF